MGLRTVARSGCLVVALILLPAAALAVEAPKITATSLPSPLPRPYNETADAKADVDRAIARAKASGKHVLLDFGGNWCADCRVLAAVMDLNEVRPHIERHFETAMIDIGLRTKNLDIAARYGIKVDAVPLVIVLDSAGGFVNSGNPTALADARSMRAQAIVDTIFGWLAPAPRN